MTRAIDLHAHLFPQCLWRAIEAGGDWHGIRCERDSDGREHLNVRGRHQGEIGPKMRFTPQERLAHMDAIGTDVHVVSVTPSLFGYDLEEAPAVAAAREVNDEIAGLARQWPQRFAGLANLPLPHVGAAVAELQRAVGSLGLKGAMLDTQVNSRNWDEPEWGPLFQAAEGVGALLFFHPSRSIVQQRINRYHLANTIGNPLEDMLAVAALIFGGVLERHPDLKVAIAHGGGGICYGIGRLDRGWEARPEARLHIPHPPSHYLRRFYYDTITWSEAALRFLIDTVGADRVVLGSDFPYDMGPESPARWLEAMPRITPREKDLILGQNLQQLLGP